MSCHGVVTRVCVTHTHMATSSHPNKESIIHCGSHHHPLTEVLLPPTTSRAAPPHASRICRPLLSSPHSHTPSYFLLQYGRHCCTTPTSALSVPPPHHQSIQPLWFIPITLRSLTHSMPQLLIPFHCPMSPSQ